MSTSTDKPSLQVVQFEVVWLISVILDITTAYANADLNSGSSITKNHGYVTTFNLHVILYWKQRVSCLKDSDARSVIHENGNWKAK